MTDPSIIPWGWLWVMVGVGGGGFMLAFHGVDQRNPSRVAEAGIGVVIAATLLCMAILLVNWGSIAWDVLRGRAQEVAQLQKESDAYRK